MIALVRDVRTDEPLGIHRTALDANGRKVEIGGLSRMTLGPAGSGAVKLTPDTAVETCLGLGEGIETVLSLRDIVGLETLPVWSVLAANRLAVFPVLAGIEGLWLAVDHDETGLAAAAAVRVRWQAAGVEVVTVTPRAPGVDLNDLIVGEHRAR
jgi:putative DNA primase/helicase